VSPPVRVFVSIPTYLEASNIEVFLRRLRSSAPDADVLVIDDGSTDGTADIAEKVAAELGHIEVLRRPHKMGLGSAYRAGHAIGIARGYDVLVQMDADLSHDPAALASLLAEIERGADLALGSRYVPGGTIPHWPAHRRALSRTGCRYAARMLRIPINDATGGYRAYRADALRTIGYEGTRANGYAFQIELTYRLARSGARIVEVPIAFTDRVRGSSKMSLGIVGEAIGLVTWWGMLDRFSARGARASGGRARP